MKVAIVTGSTRGIGRGIAQALSRTGYRVVLNYLSNAKVAREASRSLEGREHLLVRADVRRPAGARAVVGAARKAWGRVDVLVNNVGDFYFTPVSEMALDRWEDLWDSNVRSALHCTREALPLMRKRRSGCIVNLGGPVAQTVRGNANAVAYNMAKTALVIFTKSLAQAEATHGIRVNIVNPGFIRTYAYTEKDVAEMSPRVPMKRMGTPEDVAGAVEYLVDDKAAYVTGTVIDVGGGLWV